jgi:hypothetical protein
LGCDTEEEGRQAAEDGGNMRCPTLCRAAAITDNVQLAARMSCALAAPDHYVPIIEDPRMTRADRKLEVLRINNAVGRSKVETIFLCDLPAEATSLIEAEFAPLLRSRLSARISSRANQTAGRPPEQRFHFRSDILATTHRRLSLGPMIRPAVRSAPRYSSKPRPRSRLKFRLLQARE